MWRRKEIRDGRWNEGTKERQVCHFIVPSPQHESIIGRVQFGVSKVVGCILHFLAYSHRESAYREYEDCSPSITLSLHRSLCAERTARTATQICLRSDSERPGALSVSAACFSLITEQPLSDRYQRQRTNLRRALYVHE